MKEVRIGHEQCENCKSQMGMEVSAFYANCLLQSRRYFGHSQKLRASQTCFWRHRSVLPLEPNSEAHFMSVVGNIRKLFFTQECAAPLINYL